MPNYFVEGNAQIEAPNVAIAMATKGDTDPSSQPAHPPTPLGGPPLSASSSIATTSALGTGTPISDIEDKPGNNGIPDSLRGGTLGESYSSRLRKFEKQLLYRASHTSTKENLEIGGIEEIPESHEFEIERQSQYFHTQGDMKPHRCQGSDLHSAPRPLNRTHIASSNCRAFCNRTQDIATKSRGYWFNQSIGGI